MTNFILRIACLLELERIVTMQCLNYVMCREWNLESFFAFEKFDCVDEKLFIGYLITTLVKRPDARLAPHGCVSTLSMVLALPLWQSSCWYRTLRIGSNNNNDVLQPWHPSTLFRYLESEFFNHYIVLARW